jgi:RimJ/RimL family protein N-acetyltransferase
LFESAELYGRELAACEIPDLQALFDANPEYFLSVNGCPPDSDEAQREFFEMPPAHLGFSRRWVAGFFDRSGELVGVVVMVSDLATTGVWHIALFLLATRLHGRGLGSSIYRALESWMRRAGAQWLRLGVVKGHEKAERFWQKHGYREVRTRERIDAGGQANDVRVLVKPLGAFGVAEYLELVPRDRPGSTLP